MKKFLNSFGKFFSFKYKEQYSIGMEVVKNRSDLYRFLLCLILMPVLNEEVQAETISVVPEYKWGSPIYSVPYIYDSYDEIKAARTPVVLNVLGSGSYLKTSPRTDKRCGAGDLLYTNQTDEINGYVVGERENPHIVCDGEWGWYTAYSQPVSAILVCPDEFTLSADTLSCDLTNYYQLSTPADDNPNRCDDNPEGNPCNPATGNKSQTEVDYPTANHGGLEFVRNYNSQKQFGDSKGLGLNWTHSYSRQLYASQEYSFQPEMLMSSVQSSLYGTAKAACISGWSEISGTAWGGELANATSSLVGSFSCRISMNGKIIADFPITSTYKFPAFNSLASVTDMVRISRPNGTSYNFDFTNNQWVSRNVQSVTLTQTVNGWMFTDENGTQEIYDDKGILQSIADLRGNIQTLNYNTQNQLVRIDTNTGDYFNFGYDSSGHIISLADQGGRVWNYQYNADGNLEYVIYPDGTSTDNTDNSRKQYHYNEKNLTSNNDLIYALTGLTDERGTRFATWSYDSTGRATSAEHVGGVGRVQFQYNADGSTTVTNSRNQTRTYNYEIQKGHRVVSSISGTPCLDCQNGRMKSRNYDVNGNLSSFTNWNNAITQYGNYDIKGQYGYKIEAVATPEERRTDYTYDPRYYNKIITKTESSVAAGNTKVTTYTYDDFGNRTSISIEGFQVDGSAVSRIITYQYNGPLNQLSQIDGPRTDIADITTLNYYANESSEGVNRGRLKEIENSNGLQVRSNLQYTATGKVQSENRPNGLILNYTYYAGNDRLETLTQLVSGQSTTTQWTYLATGEVESITTAYGTADATIITFEFDDARRLIRITDGQGHYIKYTLDTEGNKQAENTYDNSNVLKKVLFQTFDIYNRLDITMQANSSIDSDFAPDGTLDLQTDGNNVVTDYSYDALKRLTQTTQNFNGYDPKTTNMLTQYEYDTADRLTTVTDPNGNTTHYVYDDLDNLLSQTSPDTGTTTYSYDAAGNIATKTDAKGQNFTYIYDALNRLTLLDAPGTEDDITYNYDNCTYGIGHLCSITRGETTTVEYNYDLFGNITTHQGMVYTYDNAQRVKTITYPSSAIVTYNYDANGQVSQVELAQNGETTTLANSINYAPFGPLTDMSYGNGLSMDVALDTAYQTESINVWDALNLIDYQYDGNGNLTQRNRNSQTESYNYDALSRLDTASGDFGNQNYEYDQNGNRTQLIADVTTTGYGYEPSSNRLDLIGSLDIQLDANGNTLTQGSRSYTYDSHNRLKTASDNGATSGSYVYNGLGQRSSKIVNGIQTQYRYGLDGTLLVELDTNGTPNKEYITLNGQPLAVLVGGSTASSPTSVDQIIDNTDVTTQATGIWINSTSVSGFQGSNYQYHAANGAPPGGIAIDNTAGSVVGVWPTSTSVSGFNGGNYQYHAAGIGANMFTWPLTTAGDYEVYAKWTAHANRASDATYTVFHAAGSTPVTVSQQQNGGQWISLGQYTFATGASHRVELSDQANGYVVADAVQLIPVGGAAPNTATWTPTISTAGDYEVYAKWTAHANRASDATYTVFHAAGSTPVTVNQQQSGGQWISLGQYTFATGASHRVELSDQANGYVIADAVSFVPVGALPNQYTWYLNLPGPGDYEVYAKWTAHANRASDATYTVNHTSGATPVMVDQQQSGGQWVSLGTYALDETSSVSLSDQADGYVIADAIRVVGSSNGIPSSAGLYYIHNDHLGTPQVLSNEDGETAWTVDYDPFEQATINEDADGDGNSISFNLRFPGQYYDSETDLHYNYFRYYDPGTGRYITSDPIGLDGGLNTYSYVENNPLNWEDFFGLAKGGKKNLSTEGFNKNSDPKKVEKALKEAIQKNQKLRIKALRALLKVIKRGGTMSIVPNLIKGILQEQCVMGDITACQILNSLDKDALICES